MKFKDRINHTTYHECPQCGREFAAILLMKDPHEFWDNVFVDCPHCDTPLEITIGLSGIQGVH